DFQVSDKASDAPIVESDKGSKCRVDRTQMVRNVTGTHKRRALGMTAEIHQTAHSESNNAGCFEVAIRTREAEAGYGGHDQSRADHPECLVTETDPIQI